MTRSGQLVLKGISLSRGGRCLIKGLSLLLGPGCAALITGPNGSGKSSLLRMVAGFLEADSGDVLIDGRLAIANEALALDTALPLLEALRFWARLDRQSDAVLAGALDALGLASLDQVPVRMLSTGQRKRAILARVVASGAAIWLLDEPANGLDQASIALLEAAIARHRAGGGIVLLATHQPVALPDAVLIEISG